MDDVTIKEIKTLSGVEQEVNSDEVSHVFYPWRRFLARTFDIFMYSIIWSAFLAFIFRVNIVNRSSLGNLLDSFIEIVMMLFLEPIWLHLFGTTPGKAIFGLRIETLDGVKLSYGEGLERTWGVLGAGMGYNIPIYNIFRLWKSYTLCGENETQPWDESISYIIKDTKRYRGLVCIGSYAAGLFVLITMMSAQYLPPNRGDLTVAEFAENYNYYSKFLDINFGNEYLDENGKWAERDIDGTIYVEIGHAENPQYHFTIENGHVTGVSFAVEIKNNEDWLSSYDSQMFLASIAFIGAQNEMRLFSKIPKRIAEQISNNTFQNFDFTEAGIAVTCNTDYSGYTKSSFLFPKENEEENYFSLEFSANKQR